MSVREIVGDYEVVDLLQQGKAGVIATDAGYEAVCSVRSYAGAEKLYGLNPEYARSATVLAGSTDQLVELGVKPRYVNAVKELWSRPLSIVLPCPQLPSYLHKGRFNLCFRVPTDELLQQFLLKTGPLLVADYGMGDYAPCATPEQTGQYYGDRIDFLMNIGTREPKPVTVIRILDDAIDVLRQGSVRFDETTGEFTRP